MAIQDIDTIQSPGILEQGYAISRIIYHLERISFFDTSPDKGKLLDLKTQKHWVSGTINLKLVPIEHHRL